MHRLVIQTITRQIAWTEALKKNVRLGQKLQKQLSAALCLQVQRYATLISVQHKMPKAHARLLLRPEATRRISCQILYFYNIGAIITQKHTAVLPRQPLRKIYYLYAL